VSLFREKEVARGGDTGPRAKQQLNGASVQCRTDILTRDADDEIRPVVAVEVAGCEAVTEEVVGLRGTRELSHWWK
jgi:hypothetical protein